MDKKSILAIVLSLVVLYTYQIFFVKPVPPQKTPAKQEVTTAKDTAPGQPTAPPAPMTSPVPGGVLLQSQQKSLDYKEIPIDTDVYKAVFSTRGGALKSLKLKKYHKSIEKNSALIELVDLKAGMPAPLTLSFAGSDFNVPDDALYEAKLATPTQPGEAGRLTFTLEYPNILRIEKIYKFNLNSYLFDLEVRVSNLTGNTLNQETSLNWYQYVDPQAEEDSYGHDGPVTMVGKSIERENVKKIETTKTMGPAVSWGGFESKYFLAAMIPQNPSLTSLSVAKNAANMVILSMKTPKSIIPPGQTGLANYSLYLGPKDYSLLKARNVGLEDSIDFGDWLKWLAMPMLIVLKFLYNSVIPNYGIAIIILTTLIKILFWPLGNKSYRSMKEMQKLQPKMAELREKYKNDKARISQEMMALYKAHKVNPMGGCLPMVIQIPVFFGLYKTLLYAIELRHSPLAWWIQDLSEKDPYYITPLIMGATMFVQQKMTPPAGDPTQAKIMLFMPVIFTFMFLNFPSGLVIYWLFNNIISIGQQYYINKKTS